MIEETPHEQTAQVCNIGVIFRQRKNSFIKQKISKYRGQNFRLIINTESSIEEY